MISMTVVDDKVIVRYLDSAVDSIFKILPLYEENNETLDDYVDSLILELRGFVSEYGSVGTIEYISIISTLNGIRKIIDEKGNQPKVRREVFKCIDVIKKIRNMIEGG